MARPRKKGALLPEHVHAVTKGKKTYYYFQAHRGTERQTTRHPLGTDATSPDFWMRLARLQKSPLEPQRETVGALIERFKQTAEWAHLAQATKDNYHSSFRRLKLMWERLRVDELRTRDIYDFRDAMQDRPAAANKMLSHIQVLLKFAKKLELVTTNVADGVDRLKEDVEGTYPWSEDDYQFVTQNAPEAIRRLAKLGRMTGQREANLVLMGPSDLVHDGMIIKIRKLRQHRVVSLSASHFVPLTRAEMAELHSWKVGDGTTYLQSRKGKPFTENGLRKIWADWKKAHPRFAEKRLTVHGLRATKVQDMCFAGASDGQIANEIGMSTEMVRTYTRNIDKSRIARASRDSREASNSNIVKLRANG